MPETHEDASVDGEIVESTGRAIMRASASGDMESSLAVALSEAEINQQIATAHRYPRSMQRAMENIMFLATQDADTAAECHYALPRGRDADGKAKTVEGPSVRLAELIFQQWGNNRVATRIVVVDRKEKFVEAEAIYHDLETNSAQLARVRRRISDKRGHLFNDDMITVTGNAAAAIAKRNAILAGVPKPVWRKVYAAVLKVITGDATTVAARRITMAEKFEKLGIKRDQLWKILSVNGELDVGPTEIVVATGFYSALVNGEVTLEDLLRDATPGGATAGKKLADAFGAKPAASNPIQTESSPNRALERKRAWPEAPDQIQHGAKTEMHDPQTGEVAETEPEPEPNPKDTVAMAQESAVESDQARAQAETRVDPETAVSGAPLDNKAAIENLEGMFDLVQVMDLWVNARQSEIFLKGDDAFQSQIRSAFWNRVVELSEEIDPAASLELYELWLESKPHEVEITKYFQKFMRSNIWLAQSQAEKTRMGQLIIKAKMPPKGRT